MAEEGKGKEPGHEARARGARQGHQDPDKVLWDQGASAGAAKAHSAKEGRAEEGGERPRRAGQATR